MISTRGIGFNWNMFSESVVFICLVSFHFWPDFIRKIVRTLLLLSVVVSVGFQFRVVVVFLSVFLDGSHLISWLIDSYFEYLWRVAVDWVGVMMMMMMVLFSLRDSFLNRLLSELGSHCILNTDLIDGVSWLFRFLYFFNDFILRLFFLGLFRLIWLRFFRLFFFLY